AEDGHAVRIAAECADVPLDPLKGGLLVLQTVIARVRTERAVGSKSEDVQPIVQADDNDAPRPTEQRIVTRPRATAKSTAVNVSHYRQILRSRRCPDVEVQAILVAQGRAGLRARAGESSGLQRAAPGGRRLGRRPAEILDGRRGEGNSLPRIDAVDDDAADGPPVRLHGRAWLARRTEVDFDAVRLSRIFDDIFCNFCLTGGRDTYRQQDGPREHPLLRTGHGKEHRPPLKS